jgi:hypothetical protein
MMRVVTIENTDQYAIVSCGGGVAYIMSRKRDAMSFSVQGDDASFFFKTYKGLLRGWCTPRSVYYDLSKNQMLALLFNEYEHVAEMDITRVERLQ